MAITDEQVKDLEETTFSGVLSAAHGDKRTTFSPPGEMLKLLDRARREAKGPKRTKVHLARFSRGK